MSACTSRLLKSTLAAGLAAITFLTGLPPTMAADHGDAPVRVGETIGRPQRPLRVPGPERQQPRGRDTDGRGVHRAERGRQFLGVRSRVGVRVPVRYHLQCPTGPAHPGPFLAETRVRRHPQTATIILCRDRCSESPPIGRRFRALTTSSNLGDNPPAPTITTGPRRHPVLRRIGRRPLLLRHPGLQPLRRLGARERPIRDPPCFSAAGTASRAITPWRSRFPSR